MTACCCCSWAALGLIMLFCLCLLCYGNRVVCYYTKIFAYYMILLFSVTVPIPLALFRPKHPGNLNYLSFFMKQAMKLFGVTWEVRGQENLNYKDAAILVCNHQSSLDVASLMHLVPFLPSVVSVQKKELLYTGPFGIFFWLAGGVFIDRGNSTQARNALNHEMDRIIVKKTKMIIFPEGTRNRQGGMLAFKKGAFHLAIKSQVPIMPVVISSYASFYDENVKRFESGGKVIITSLPAVTTEGLSLDDLDSLMENVRSQMLKVFNQNSTLDQKTTESEIKK